MQQNKIVTFINHSANEVVFDTLGTNFKNIQIYTKKKNLVYKFVSQLSLLERRDVGDMLRPIDSFLLMKFELLHNPEGKKPKPFIFIRIGQEDKWIVSDQLRNYKPSKELINLYRVTLGYDPKPKEEIATLDMIGWFLEKQFDNKRYIIERHPEKSEVRHITIGSKRLMEEYKMLFGEEFKKDRDLNPDFVISDKKYKNRHGFKTIHIEVERGARNEMEVLRKLWKIKKLDRQTYFIFANEKVKEFWLEAFHDYEKKVQKKLKDGLIYYCTYEELQHNWDKPFMKYNSVYH